MGVVLLLGSITSFSMEVWLALTRIWMLLRTRGGWPTLSHPQFSQLISPTATSYHLGYSSCGWLILVLNLIFGCRIRFDRMDGGESDSLNSRKTTETKPSQPEVRMS